MWRAVCSIAAKQGVVLLCLSRMPYCIRQCSSSGCMALHLHLTCTLMQKGIRDKQRGITPSCVATTFSSLALMWGIALGALARRGL